MNSIDLECLVYSKLADYQENKLLLAVSGGVDSMVLASILRKKNFKIGLAHCNYHLRGNDSNLDQKLIEDWAKNNQISLHIKSCPIPKNSSNIQNTARELRFSYFDDIKRDFGYQFLITAHHMEDMIEGFFLNLIRGAGIKGLNTMPVSYKNSLKPLENLNKDDLYNYAETNQILFREDISNMEDKYARNLIRHQVIPVFKSINPAFLKTTNRSLKLLGELDVLLDYYRTIWKSKNVQFSNTFTKINFCLNEEDYFLHEYLAENGFHYNEIQDIKATLGSPGKQFKSRTDQTLYIDRGCLYIVKVNTADSFEEIVIPDEKENFINKNGICVNIKLFSVDNFDLRVMVKNPLIIYVDFDKIKFPLVIRHWTKGDKMSPYGMQGKKKKVKKILADNKSISAFKKQELVLTSGDEIYWLVGHTIAHEIRVTELTKKIMEISILKEN